jgi:hypothetical protein
MDVHKEKPLQAWMVLDVGSSDVSGPPTIVEPSVTGDRSFLGADPSLHSKLLEWCKTFET